MQKDEEVGKVAQATPIVISKALELFLQLVVGRSFPRHHRAWFQEGRSVPHVRHSLFLHTPQIGTQCIYADDISAKEEG
ncbi:hypothetical protein BGW80DRAFT_1424391, partial [Lactifluus volemus]